MKKYLRRGLMIVGLLLVAYLGLYFWVRDVSHSKSTLAGNHTVVRVRSVTSRSDVAAWYVSGHPEVMDSLRTTISMMKTGIVSEGNGWVYASDSRLYSLFLPALRAEAAFRGWNDHGVLGVE